MTLGIIGEKYLQSLPPKRVRHCGYGYMQTLDVTVNWKKRGSWIIEIADVFQITRDTISLCQKKKQQEKQEEVDLCITVVCNFLKNWSKRHVLNSRLCVITMIHSLHGADWGAIWAAVLTETDGLLLLMSWTARKEQPHPRPLSSFQVRGGWRHFVSV